MTIDLEFQSPEVIAKELLIAFIENNNFPFPQLKPDILEYEAFALTIGQMYRIILEEIKKTIST